MYLTQEELKSQTKLCRSCYKIKTKDNFYPHPHNTTGVYSKCKSCISEENKSKRKSDPLWKLERICRDRTIKAFRSKNIKKNSNTRELLGIDWDGLKEYIEKQFTEGMTWDNHTVDGWHIDHIIPLSSAKTEKELTNLCHYKNLQPLWAFENLSKGSNII